MFINDEYDKILYKNYETEENLYSYLDNTVVEKVPLHDLTFLNIGSDFPPKSQESRVREYLDNEKLFKGDIVNVLSEIQARILINLRRTALSGGTLYYNKPSIENYFRLLTKSKSDMLVANVISYTTYSKDVKQEEFVESFSSYLERNNLVENIGQDISIYGEAIIVTSLNHKGTYDIKLVKPYNWYPVVNDYTKDTIAHVVVSPIMFNGIKHIIVEVHYIGYFDRLIYTYKDSKLGDVIENSRIKTNLSDFAVTVISNDNLFGNSDYTDIKDTITQITVDNTLLDFICNVYVTPSFQGGRHTLEQDSKGNREFVLGKYHVILDEHKVEQIKVENYSDELRKNKKLKLNTLGRLTGMENVFRDKESVGVLNNFSALRLAKESDVNTVRKIKKRIEQSLIDLAYKSSSLVGVNLDINNFSIDWDISVAIDIREKAEIEQIRTGNKATSSVVSSIERLDNVSTAQAEKELELIKNEDNIGGSKL